MPINKVCQIVPLKFYFSDVINDLAIHLDYVNNLAATAPHPLTIIIEMPMNLREG